MDNITKEYCGNKVLKGVNIQIKPGEIHALMGENGAGKSTLMNILFGMPVIHSTGGFGGSVEMAGQPVTIDTPLKAMELGIGMVHQEFMLIPGFTVTENIKIGREISTPNLVSRVFGKSMETLDFETMAKDARKALKTIGLQIEDYVKVAGLPVGYMQFIEIAREIDKTGIRLLVFDEPTAVLTESEAEHLLDAMKVIASHGIAIIFITHRLDEVMAVADSMTILRDGEFVSRKEIKDTNVVEIAELMIGRKVEKLLDDVEDTRVLSDGDIAVKFHDYKVKMPGEVVKGIDLDIRKGEIFGIGGLAGQGKLGIPNGVMGLYEASGEVTINGKVLALDKLGDALKHKVAFVSEDRKGVG
ncbi:MAG: ATP-binding cassette domain-containing protein, partial [Lachnospiraceae bacterium]